ncbi:MAG: cation transporter [Rhizobiales bacterium]|nr:cation transporter [Hyphomicrobiales bacterium]
MVGGCGCNNKSFDGVSEAYKRILWIVISLNAAMFVVEMVAGIKAQSQALQADALDFFGDAITYGLSLAVIGQSLHLRAKVALFKGISLLMMGIWVFASTVYRVFYLGVPVAETMGMIGLLALLANLASVLLLVRYKDGDANVRSVWLCSRNDAIGNIAVMLAALGVWGTATGWPDLIVAGLMASLFLSSAIQIIIQARAEMKQSEFA